MLTSRIPRSALDGSNRQVAPVGPTFLSQARKPNAAILSDKIAAADTPIAARVLQRGNKPMHRADMSTHGLAFAQRTVRQRGMDASLPCAANALICRDSLWTWSRKGCWPAPEGAAGSRPWRQGSAV